MSFSAPWSAADIPSQTGRTALVTGANSGLGYETSLELARKGARVLMACRTPSKAEGARDAILAEVPGAEIDLVALDLSDLDAVAACAEAVRSSHGRLDLLINNAGVMSPGTREATAQGFELQLGVNHFGHFALTMRLLDLLRAAPGARVVSVASNGHRMGSMDFDDLNWSRSYNRYTSYGRSKLANLLFAFELDRRLRALGSDVASLAAHPGGSNTNLTQVATSARGALLDRLVLPLIFAFTQPPSEGALPTLRAATDPEAVGGEYYGPRGLLQLAGPPVKVGTNALARDEAVARRLWEVSEELTRTRFPAG